MKDFVAKIYAPDGDCHTGTAWMVSEKYAITAFHCIDNGKGKPYPTSRRYTLKFESGQNVYAVVDEYDANVDVALLHILDASFQTEGKLIFEKLPSAAAWDKYPGRNQAYWESYGYPLAHDLGLTIGGTVRLPEARVDGLIAGTEPAIQLSCDEGGLGFLNGMSGGAVIYNGSIVGIISSAPPDLKQKVIHAIPIERIIEVLPTVRIIIENNYRWAVEKVAPNILGSNIAVALNLDEKCEIKKTPNLEYKADKFYGRDTDVVNIKALLESEDLRSLSLTGTEGAGKKTLALNVGNNCLKLFERVFFVDLSPVQQPRRVLPEIANALEVKEAYDNFIEETLIIEIGNRKILLIVNGSELLKCIIPSLERILNGCPNLRIISIGVERLGLENEQEYRLRPLTLPTDEQIKSRADLENIDVIAFFADFAKKSYSKFKLNEGNLPVIAHLCKLIGGLPLATIIAAAYTANMFDDLMLNSELIEFRKKLIEIETQQGQDSLQYIVDVACNSLDTDTRSLLFRLSVFTGVCGVEAAWEIDKSADISPHTNTRLELLVKSNLLLMCTTKGGSQYFYMSPYIQRYCQNRLKDTRELESTFRDHATYYSQLAAKAERRLTLLSSSEMRGCLERLELEYNNIAAAIEWAYMNSNIHENIDLGLGITGNLFWFWNLRGTLLEGLYWSKRLTENASADSENYGLTLYCAGGLAFLQGDFLNARRWLTHSIVVLEKTGNGRRLAYALVILGMVALYQNHIDEALWHEQRSVRLFNQIGDVAGLALSLNDLGNVELESGNIVKAESYYLQSNVIWDNLGNKWGQGLTSGNLGHLAWRRCDYDSARNWLIKAMSIQKTGRYQWGYAESIKRMGYVFLAKKEYKAAAGLFYDSLMLHHKLGRKQLVADCLDGLAEIETDLKQPLPAAYLFGAAMKIRDEIQVSLPPAARILRDGIVQAASLTMKETDGDAIFKFALTEGMKKSYSEAITLATTYALKIIQDS